MKINHPRHLPAQMLAVAVALFTLTMTTHAASGTWTNLTGGSWAAPANWKTNGIATGVGNTADFSTLALSGNTTVTLDGAETIGNLIFGDQRNVFGWTLSTGSGGPLTLAVTNGSPSITLNGQATTISVVLAGTSGFTLAGVGTGTLTLAGANTYSGPTIITNGTVNVTANESAATGGWLMPSNYAPATVNFEAGSTVVVAPGNMMQLGSFPRNGTPNNQTMNVAGNVTNNGILQVAIGGVLNINSGGFWLQTGAMTNATTPNSGYYAEISVNSGGSFVYNGPSLILLAGSDLNTGDGELAIAGGTFTTSQAFTNDITDAGSGTGEIVMTANGSLVLSANLPQLSYGANINGNPFISLGAGGGVINTAGFSTALTNIIGGAGSLAKLGAGTLILNAADTYTGGTTLSNGTLEVDGALSTGTVTVDGGVLDGAGSIGGGVTINGGTVSPGTAAALGTMTISGPLSIAGGTVSLRISKTGGFPSSDSLLNMSSVTYGGTLTVANATSDGNQLAAGDTFQLFGSGSYSGGFATFNLPTLPAGLNWDLSDLSQNGSIAVSANAATPLFSPQAGGYVGALTVTLTSDSGATIHYTTDGSDPTTSGTAVSGASPLSVTIPVNTNLTIMAYASQSAHGNSGTVSATYSTIATPTWVGLFGGSWLTANNWSNNVIPNASGVTADFSTLTMIFSPNVSLDNPQTVGHLIFGDVGNTYSWEIDAGNGGSLVLNNGAAASTIAVENQTTTITAPLTGTNGMILSGGGILMLTANNPLSGGTTVNAGTLNASTASSTTFGAVGNGNLTVNNGGTVIANGVGSLLGLGSAASNKTITLNTGGLLTNTPGTSSLLYALVLNGGTLAANTADPIFGNWDLTYGVSTLGNGNISSIAGGNVALSQTNGTVFNILAGDTVNVSSVIELTTSSQDNGLIKEGAGTLVLNDTNTYASATTVSNGTLDVNGSIGGGAVTVNGGTLEGVGSISGPVTVNGGTVSSGTAALATLSISNTLSLSGASTVALRISKTGGTPANDSLAGMSSVVLGGTLTVANITSDGHQFAVGDTFQLFSSARYSGAFTTFNLPTLPAGLNWGTFRLAVNGTLFVESGPGTPAFLPPAGTYVGAQSVTITSDPGATILYTTDGSNPTTSGTRLSGISPLGGVIVPAGVTETINAYATNTGEVPSAVASATYTTYPSAIWTNTEGGTWSAETNWVNDAVGNGIGVTADFSQLTLNGNTTVTLTGPETIGTLLFADQNDASGWILNGSGPLIMNGGASVAGIVTSNQSVSILTTVTGTNGLAVSGGGTLALFGTNTYSGGTIISNGATLQLALSNTVAGATDLAAGTGPITNNGVLDIANDGTTGSPSVVMTNTIKGVGTINVAANQEINFTGPGSMSNFTGAINIPTSVVTNGQMDITSTNVNLNSNAVISIASGGTLWVNGFGVNVPATVNVSGTGNGRSLGAIRVDGSGTISGPVNLQGNVSLGGNTTTITGTISGVISDGGNGYGVNSIGGTNTITLAGNNTYTGPTTLTNGTIDVTGNESAATGGWIMDNANDTTSIVPAPADQVNVQAGGIVVVGPTNQVIIGEAIRTTLNLTAATFNVAGAVTNNGLLRVANTGTLTINSGGIWVQTGPMTNQTSPSSGGSSTITINSGGSFIYNGSIPSLLAGCHTSSSGNGTMNVNGSGTYTTSQGFANDAIPLAGTSTGVGTLILGTGGTVILSANVPELNLGENPTNANPVAPFMKLNTGGGVINTAGFSTALTNAIANDGSVTTGSLTKAGAGTLTLGVSNSYTGPTIVSGGTLLITGSINTGAVTVGSTATLGGNGIIAGPTTISAGGTLQPGLGGSDASPLTMTKTLTLSGNALIAVNRTNTPNAAMVTGVTTLTYGGTLTVVNVGSPVQLNDSFQLFSAGAYVGNFAVKNLPTLGSGLAWSWTPTTGTLSVIAVNTTPPDITFTVSNHVLSLAWPSDHTGWVLEVQTNNLAQGISGQPNDWGTVAGSSLTNQVSVPITATNEFYRLVYP